MKGYLRIRIYGDSTERFLNLCSFHGMKIWKLNLLDDGYEMNIHLSDMYRMKPLLKKTNTHFKIIQKNGMPFFLYKNRKRKLYFCGGFICISLLLFLSTFIWDIHLTGNQRCTNEEMLSYLYEEQLRPGIKQLDVNCETIERNIREKFSEIVWVSASIDGCRLVIQMKENEDLMKMNQAVEDTAEQKASDIIACKNGIVKSIVTRTGTPLVHAGDRVCKGDVLVKGEVEITDDTGEVIDYRYVKADADVIGITEYQYTEYLPLEYQEKVYSDAEIKQYFLKIGNVQILMKNPFKKMSGDHKEKILWSRQLSTGESIYLPVYYGTSTVKEYRFENRVYQKDNVQMILSREFSLFCNELEKKGVQITENNVKILIDENQAAATGSLSLVEPLGELADIELERNNMNGTVRNDH